MPTINQLTTSDKAHWLVHLNALKLEKGNVTTINRYISGSSQLPKLKHPALIHDWYDADAKGRLAIEALNG